MKSFGSLVYAQTKEELDKEFEELMELQAVEQNPCCTAYFEDLGKIEKAWALCYRKDLQRCRGTIYGG